jgi:predicted enzyme related to lactoylglutathione lyase
MSNPVVHFEVVGRDAAALQNFYRQAFGWQIDAPGHGAGPPDYAMVHPQAGTGIDGGIGGGIGESDEGHVTFYVAVPDIKAALSAIKALGGTRVFGPEDVPGGPTIALFADPEGHTVGLVQVRE